MQNNNAPPCEIQKLNENEKETPMEHSTEDWSDSEKIRTVDELRPEEVRWFYKKDAKEILWLPLIGRDSLAIELAYRRHNAILAMQNEEREKIASTSIPKEAEELIPEKHWAKTAVALGGLYGMTYEPVGNLSKKTGAVSPSSTSKTLDTSSMDDDSAKTFVYRLKLLYWEGPRLPLARGTWFLNSGGENWQPLDVNSSRLVKRVEEQHMKTFGGHRIRNPKLMTGQNFELVACEVVDEAEERKPGSGCRVRWFSVDEIFLYNYSHSSRLWRYLKLTPAGAKLIRGYHTEASYDDGPPPVKHLVLVIHGIGQMHLKNLVQKVDHVRRTADELIRQRFPEGTSPPMILPVNWRADLQLDEEAVHDITPNYLEKIRALVNESIMDLMYYASPIYGPKVIRGLSVVLNRTYETYITHDPGFISRNRRVSLAAHSLGSVISYDILSIDGNMGSNGIVDDRVTIMPRPDEKTSRLIFPVYHLFSIGSPLGTFFAARQWRGTRILHPAGGASDFRLHNIYHPADVIAYRIEPLISSIYAGIKPLHINKCDAKDQTPYDRLPNEKLHLKFRSTSPPLSPKTNVIDATKAVQNPPLATPKERPVEEEIVMNSDIAEIPSEKALPYRVDYALRPGRMINPYWSALISHNAYWTNRDMVMYLLTTLCGQPKNQ